MYKPDATPRRRLMSSLLTKSAIQSSSSLSLLLSHILGQRLLLLLRHSSSTESPQPLNLLRQFRNLAMDLTSTWTFGLGNGTDFLSDPAASDRYFRLFDESAYNAFWRSEFPWLTKVVGVTGLFAPPKVAELARKETVGWSRGLCERAGEKGLEAEMGAEDSEKGEKSRGQSGKETTLYLRMREGLKGIYAGSNKSAEYVKQELAVELLDQLGAGHEPMGTLLSWVVMELSQRKEWQERLRREIREKQGVLEFLRIGEKKEQQQQQERNREAKEDYPAETNSTQAARALDVLPVLDAVLQETLRVYSVNPGPQPRVVPKGGYTIKLNVPSSASKSGKEERVTEVFLPAGTVVTASSYCLHRNEDVFGPNADEWKPERWLEAGEEKRREMEGWMWTFASGARMCIGMHLALRCEWLPSLLPLLTVRFNIASWAREDHHTTGMNKGGNQDLAESFAGCILSWQKEIYLDYGFFFLFFEPNLTESFSSPEISDCGHLQRVRDEHRRQHRRHEAAGWLPGISRRGRISGGLQEGVK